MEGSQQTGATPTHPDHDNTNARQYAQTVSEEELFETSRNHSFRPHFAHPPGRPLVWVKFGDIRRQAEGETQMLAWRWTQRVNNPTISIPEVYKIFSRGRRTFIIMQLLDAETVNKCVQYPADDCYDLVAEGIQLLRRMPVPDDATPGPYSRDPDFRKVNPQLFNDHRASTVYQSIDELETHINRVAKRGYRRAGPQHYPTVSFETELVFCYCDLNDENFLFNTDSAGRLRLYIVDFEHASFLPVTFLAYALFVEAHRSRRWITAEPLIQRIGATLSQSNLDVLAKVNYSFVISASHIDLFKVGDGASATWQVSAPSEPALSQSDMAPPGQHASS